MAKLARIIDVVVGTALGVGVYSAVNQNASTIRREVNTEEDVQEVLTSMRNTTIVNGVATMVTFLAKRTWIGAGVALGTAPLLIVNGKALSKKGFPIDWLRFKVKNISALGFRPVERIDVE